MWVFVNGRLAIDLGGVTGTESANPTLGPSTEATFGIQRDGHYERALFHAERFAPNTSVALALDGLSICQ
ncbi:MAG: hypothetical protein AAGA48_32705 [Myxococcota bacterium]